MRLRLGDLKRGKAGEWTSPQSRIREVLESGQKTRTLRGTGPQRAHRTWVGKERTDRAEVRESASEKERSLSPVGKAENTFPLQKKGETGGP